MIYNNILETIGRTPIVRINRLAPKHVTLYAKVEFFNPGGSVKDRLAIGIIEDAERRGVLKPGQTIVEATSGNTGISLAMVAAAKGYPFVAVMVETFSIERRKIMRALGAKVILTPAAERGSGMVRKAEELAKKLASVKLTIERPVGEGDRLYGSVTTRDIEEALAAQGYSVDRRRIASEPLKTLGTHSVTIRLATSVNATIDVIVAKKR